MNEKICGDEKKTRLYIETEIFSRKPDAIISYIDSRLQYYSFSPDFTNWLIEQRSKAQEKLSIQSDPDVSCPTIQDAPKLPKWPEIKYGALYDNAEREHLEVIEKILTQETDKNKARIDEIPSELDDIKELRKTAGGYDERRELTLQYISLEDLAKELRKNNELIGDIKNKPFFGRFDFMRQGEKNEIFYLTKTSLESHVNRHGCISYIDWRAPIADIYYKNYAPVDDISFETASHKTVSGDLGLTARFDIEDGKIKKIAYSTKSGINDVRDMSDSILQKTLSAGSGDHMSEIVETIQPEQNDIIRQNSNKNIIIQGVAGSGKTAVALHRIAYLLYQNEALRNGGVFFVSPNDTFSEYVSNVLPELGEINIPIKSYESFLNVKGARKLESLSQFVERYYDGGTDDQVRSKFNLAFENKFYKICRSIEAAGQFRSKFVDLTEQKRAYDKEILDLTNSKKRLKTEIVNKKRDITLKRKQITQLNKEYLNTPFVNNDQRQLKKKIIDDTIQTRGRLEKELRETEENLQSIEAMLAQSRKHRSDIAKKEAYFRKKLSEKEDIFVLTSKANSRNVLRLRNTALDYYKQLCGDDELVSKQYENVVYLTILNLLVDIANGEKNGDDSVRHIVVDEAQDYTEPFIYYLRLLYPKATFSILGDINQNINPYHKRRSLQALLDGASYFEMSKAYRSSPEIVNFCNAIIGANNVQPARESQGEEVDVFSSSDMKNDLGAIVNSFRKAGYSRIGVITKESKTADNLANFIKEENVYIYPVYTAKGLEFDACVIIDEYSKKEKELYYVACSRAQHKLTVIKPRTKKIKTKTTSDQGTIKKTTKKAKPKVAAPSVEEEEIPVIMRHKIDRGTPILKKAKKPSIFERFR